MTDFQRQILEGIPDVLPPKKEYDPSINHAPKRKDILSEAEKRLAIRNALRYFPAKHHTLWQNLYVSSPTRLRDEGSQYR